MGQWHERKLKLMNEVFEFSADEVAKLLYNELVRLGKIRSDKPCGIITSYQSSLGKMNTIQVKITEPITGAKNLDDL